MTPRQAHDHATTPDGTRRRNRITPSDVHGAIRPCPLTPPRMFRCPGSASSCPRTSSRPIFHACLESVLSQTYESDESPAFDAGSDRGRRRLARLLRRDHRRGRRPRSPGRRGGTCPRTRPTPVRARAPARNAGLARATGEYVLFLDGERHPGPRTPCATSPTGSRRPATPTSWSSATPIRTGRARGSTSCRHTSPSRAPSPSHWTSARTC
ncbi:glycosyltransferase family A protein [Streptomyces violascens]|uniref:glycosyltransferase family A protein n=1 Tax=Streptomyces violascens TaxID=67381 RepID=UPI003570B969